jgi:hypothetical protein
MDTKDIHTHEQEKNGAINQEKKEEEEKGNDPTLGNLPVNYGGSSQTGFHQMHSAYPLVPTCHGGNGNLLYHVRGHLQYNGIYDNVEGTSFTVRKKLAEEKLQREWGVSLWAQCQAPQDSADIYTLFSLPCRVGDDEEYLEVFYQPKYHFWFVRITNYWYPAGQRSDTPITNKPVHLTLTFGLDWTSASTKQGLCIHFEGEAMCVFAYPHDRQKIPIVCGTAGRTGRIGAKALPGFYTSTPLRKHNKNPRTSNNNNNNRHRPEPEGTMVQKDGKTWWWPKGDKKNTNVLHPYMKGPLLGNASGCPQGLGSQCQSCAIKNGADVSLAQLGPFPGHMRPSHVHNWIGMIHTIRFFRSFLGIGEAKQTRCQHPEGKPYPFWSEGMKKHYLFGWVIDHPSTNRLGSGVAPTNNAYASPLHVPIDGAAIVTQHVDKKQLVHTLSLAGATDVNHRAEWRPDGQYTVAETMQALHDMHHQPYATPDATKPPDNKSQNKHRQRKAFNTLWSTGILAVLFLGFAIGSYYLFSRYQTMVRKELDYPPDGLLENSCVKRTRTSETK